MADITAIKNAVAGGRLKKIEGLVREALDAGLSAQDILDSMVATMEEVGEKFQRNEIFVPEMLVSALTMKKAIAVLKPLLTDGSAAKLGKVIIGTVKGDLHDIGKNLVALMLESVGFEVVDLGVDVAPEAYVQALRDNPDCAIVALSTLLTTTMANMRETVAAIVSSGLRGQVKIMVGGAPVTTEFAREIGADAYSDDAAEAAQTAKALVA